MIKKLFKEPLVHFIVAGMLLFLVFAFFGNSSGEMNNKTIEISKGQIDLMHSHWTRQLGRPPTESELQGLIDDHIREEILMQEALKMGLDKDDIIIRRRLAQKMEFVSGDMLTVEEPTEAQIQDYYNGHKEEFLVLGKVSFLQVFFSMDSRSEDKAFKLAEKTKRNLNKLTLEEIDFSKIGDRTMIPTEYLKRSNKQLNTDFGNTEIVKKLTEAPISNWSGPFISNYGMHLIYVLERKHQYIPDLEEVSTKIKNHLIEARQDALDRKFMAEMRSRYTIKINDEVASSYNYKYNDTPEYN